MDGVSRLEGAQEEDKEKENEEEEFSSGDISFSELRGGGDGPIGEGGSSDGDNLGGVVMPHDEMVAVDEEQGLPEASQGA